MISDAHGEVFTEVFTPAGWTRAHVAPRETDLGSDHYAVRGSNARYPTELAVTYDGREIYGIQSDADRARAFEVAKSTIFSSPMSESKARDVLVKFAEACNAYDAARNAGFCFFEDQGKRFNQIGFVAQLRRQAPEIAAEVEFILGSPKPNIKMKAGPVHQKVEKRHYRMPRIRRRMLDLPDDDSENWS